MLVTEVHTCNRLMWPKTEISGLQASLLAYQCLNTPLLTMVWSILVPFRFKQEFQHSWRLPALSEPALLCWEQDSLPERQTVGLDYANTPYSHSWLGCPWGLNAHWCALPGLLAFCHYCCHSVIAAHRCHRYNHEGTKHFFVLWCDKLRGLKKSWKSLFLFLGYSGASGPFQGSSIAVMDCEFPILTYGRELER